MLLLVKGGIIGDVVSIDSTCTSIRTVNFADNHQVIGCVSSLNDWGPTALLPVFQLLGVDYGKRKSFRALPMKNTNMMNLPNATLFILPHVQA